MPWVAKCGAFSLTFIYFIHWIHLYTVYFAHVMHSYILYDMMDSCRYLYLIHSYNWLIIISTKQYSKDHLPKLYFAQAVSTSYRHPSGATRRSFRIAPCGNVKRSRLHVAAGLDARREGQTVKCVEMRSAATPKMLCTCLRFKHIYSIIFCRGAKKFWKGSSSLIRRVSITTMLINFVQLKPSALYEGGTCCGQPQLQHGCQI